MGNGALKPVLSWEAADILAGIRALPSSSQNERLNKKCFCKILQGTNADFNGIWLISEDLDEIETLIITLGYEIGASDELRLQLLDEVTQVRKLARDEPACLARKREEEERRRKEKEERERVYDKKIKDFEKRIDEIISSTLNIEPPSPSTELLKISAAGISKPCPGTNSSDILPRINEILHEHVKLCRGRGCNVVKNFARKTAGKGICCIPCGIFTTWSKTRDPVPTTCTVGSAICKIAREKLAHFFRAADLEEPQKGARKTGRKQKKHKSKALCQSESMLLAESLQLMSSSPSAWESS